MIHRPPESKEHRAQRFGAKQLQAEARNITRRIRLGIERTGDRARLEIIKARVGGQIYGKKNSQKAS